jgi:hypothetical protein
MVVIVSKNASGLGDGYGGMDMFGWQGVYRGVQVEECPVIDENQKNAGVI